MAVKGGTHVKHGEGAVRSSDDGRGMFHGLPWIALWRDAAHLENGARKSQGNYPPENWRKGFPFTRAVRGVMRHTILYVLGDRSEDHPAAIRFNAGCLSEFEITHPECNDLHVGPETESALRWMLEQIEKAEAEAKREVKSG